ncbi:hypothetical protein NDU88_000016 [Pleurodeles waltl]|uniref:Uncharacterized protein n=1 Tax=Pleurodeles waltl TaxID=8319 RepID=A0AAV7LWY9_PLEWA|nr:hypothetical protein NDU88_000016 [Pleurodeles waltl]
MVTGRCGVPTRAPQLPWGQYTEAGLAGCHGDSTYPPLVRRKVRRRVRGSGPRAAQLLSGRRRRLTAGRPGRGRGHGCVRMNDRTRGVARAA